MKKKYPIEAFDDNIFIDFENTDSFLKEVQIPIEYGTWLRTSITSSILEQSKGIY